MAMDEYFQKQLRAGGMGNDAAVRIATDLVPPYLQVRLTSGDPMQDWHQTFIPVGRLRSSTSSLPATIVMGPCVVTAGQAYVLSDVQFRSPVDVNIWYIGMTISNATGTQRIYTYAEDVSVAAGEVASLGSPTGWHTDHKQQVGSDLTLDSSGMVTTTAGGAFWVQLNLLATGTGFEQA